MYWNNAEEMHALTKIIICNETVDIDAGRLNDTLALIDAKGAYTGEGADIGVTNNQYVGGTYDCDEYQNAWKYADKHPHSQPPAEPNPVNTNETTADNQPPAEKAEVSENTTNITKKNLANYKVKTWTGDDNTAASGSVRVQVEKTGTVQESYAEQYIQQYKNGGRPI